ncbi:hypothetical protein NKJ23_32535 [Mesorhizobium sp. M0184]
MEQDFRRANLDLCHPRRARLSMLHPQRRGRPEPASPLHPSGRSAHSSLNPRIVTFVINNVVGFLTDHNALTRTALTITSAGALQQNFRRLMEQQELVEETGQVLLIPAVGRRNFIASATMSSTKRRSPGQNCRWRGLDILYTQRRNIPYNHFDYNEKFIRKSEPTVSLGKPV